MTWKEILKIDMDEARRLGEKYAPDDMEEARLNRNMVNAGKEIERHTKKYEAVKEKIDSMKDKIDSDDYGLMRAYLKLMKENIGNDTFNSYLTALKLMAREYPIFFRGR